MLRVSTVSGVEHGKERREGRDSVDEGNGVPRDEAAVSSGTEGRSEPGCVLLREGAGSQGGGGSVPEATGEGGEATAQSKEEAMRGASEGQEGAYLICDGVNVINGVARPLEGARGDTGND